MYYHTKTKVDVPDSAYFLHIANIYCAYLMDSVASVNQISNYSWLTSDALTTMTKGVKKILKVKYSDKYYFEHYIFYNMKTKSNALISLNGAIDCIDLNANVIYEFKCVEKLQPENHLQLAIYKYIYEKIVDTKHWLRVGNTIIIQRHQLSQLPTSAIITHYNNHCIHLIINGKKVVYPLNTEFIDMVCNNNSNNNSNNNGNKISARLFNILSGEIREISYKIEDMENIMLEVIEHKYCDKKYDEDSVFIAKNKVIKNKYSIQNQT
jgi:hypothetical protein